MTLYLTCTDRSIFDGKQKPAREYGIFTTYPLREVNNVSYTTWGPAIHYKTVKIDGENVKLHRWELLPACLVLSKEEVEKHFQPEETKSKDNGTD